MDNPRWPHVWASPCSRRTDKTTMNVIINQIPTELPEGATLADALARWAPTPPFAVAVNLGFVPQTAYATVVLREADQIEIIAPVTGG